MAIVKTVAALFILICPGAVAQNPIHQSRELFHEKEFDKAKHILSTVKPTAAEYPEAQYYLGRIAVERKEYGLSIEKFETAVNANPEIAEYHNWLGVMYGVIAMSSNPLKQAYFAPKIKNEFEKAALLDPDNLQTRWGLLNYYIKAPGFLGGSWHKANETAAFIAGKSKAQGLRAHAFLHEARHEYDLAEDKLIEAVHEDPWDVENTLALAIIYEKLGKKLSARTYFLTSLQLAPGKKEAIDGLLRLD